MAEAPKQRIWDYVLSQVALRFGPETVARSPSLQAIIAEAARYVKVEAGGIWFDTRALTLGLLAAGESEENEIRSFAGRLFREWAASQVTKPVVSRVLVAGATPVESAEHFLGQEGSIHVSRSVKSLIQRSGELSLATIKTPHFDGRHLFAAMIEKGSVDDQMKSLFSKPVAKGEVAALLRRLIEDISSSSEGGGSLESWEAALGLARAGRSVPPSPGRAGPEPGASGPEIMRFSHDGARGGGDVLETARDVEALAKLICLKGSTPLAAAIFGGWGSGKTTFMEALDEKVEEIAREEARWVEEGAASPFVTRVVQIRFNAWQFVDANLWASLTAEFFDQLRAGGWRRAGTARHAALVERVNSHVHSLTAEAAARRRAAIEMNQQVIEAKEARDEAAKAVRGAAGKALSQAAVDTLGELYEAQKGNIRALGLARTGQDPGRGVDAVLEAVRSSRSILEQARAVFRIVRRYRGASLLAGLLLLIAGGAGWMLWMEGFEGFDLAAIAAGLAALGTLARAVLPALRLVASVGRRGADIARDLQAADEAAVKELLGREALLRNVTAQAETAAGSADRSDRTLARYLDPAGPSNPPRLLRYVLEDDPETKAFEKEIGLIGRARRLFQAVDDIVREEEGSGAAPQRIVLYIDDLDRCTEEQVYNVLQAIHLLLAFRSFAVVVGVDVKWIESALAAEFAAEKLPALSEIDRRQHAVQYLEKIFQVAFWLDPLSASGDGGGSFARFVKALTTPEVEAPAPAPAGPPEEPKPAPDRSAPKEAGPASGAIASGAIGSGPIAASAAEVRRTREAFRTVELEQVEIDFLASPAIAALAGSTPRSVKRLINVYRLVRSRLADERASLLGANGRPPDYPLIALTAAIETGQPVEVAAAFMEALRHVAPQNRTLVVPRGGKDPEQPRHELDPLFDEVLAVQFGAQAGVAGSATRYALVSGKCPGLLPALEAVNALRGGDVAAGDVLRIARLARRFSFNRYH